MKVVFVCGRFNPPTSGHVKLVEEMKALASREESELRLFTTGSHDPERNPLSPEAKLAFLGRVFPGVPVAQAKNAFDAAQKLAQDGFGDATLVVGQDREEMAQKLALYGEQMGLERVGFHLVPRSDDEPSATAMRLAASNGDFEAFSDLAPISDEVLVSELFRAVRLGMGVG